MENWNQKWATLSEAILAIFQDGRHSSLTDLPQDTVNIYVFTFYPHTNLKFGMKVHLGIIDIFKMYTTLSKTILAIFQDGCHGMPTNSTPKVIYLFVFTFYPYNNMKFGVKVPSVMGETKSETCLEIYLAIFKMAAVNIDW